jgi:hypothetical protein
VNLVADVTGSGERCEGYGDCYVDDLIIVVDAAPSFARP